MARARFHASAFVALLVLSLLAAPAHAQTLINPIQGGYDEVYVIAGRVVDANHEPVVGAQLRVELEQKGVRAAPLNATTNCKGDFITAFPLREIKPSGRAKVILLDETGGEVASESQALNPFYRRSDLVLHHPGTWGARCEENQHVWPVSVSVSARVLNRTAQYEVDGVTYEAKPYDGRIRLRFETVDGQLICPPLQNGPPGTCETFVPDERGDVRYTFTLDRPLDGRGRMLLYLMDDTLINATVDPETRLAVFHVEATGQGAPEFRSETPAPPLALVLVALGGGLLLARRR